MWRTGHKRGVLASTLSGWGLKWRFFSSKGPGLFGAEWWIMTTNPLLLLSLVPLTSSLLMGCAVNDSSTLSGSGGSSSAGSGGTESSSVGALASGRTGGASGASGSAGSPPVACSPENSTCSITGTCCGGKCVDVSRDVRNCGSCGNACGAQDFCASAPSVACAAAAIQNLCLNAAVTGVHDGVPIDDAATVVLVTALKAGCSTNPSGRAVDQGSTNVVDSVTGKPLAGGGELLVTAGGDAYNNPVRYLNSNRIAPIYATGTDFRRSQNQSLVVVASNLTVDHDFLVIQTVRDPTTGTLLLEAYGFDQAGTTAAAWYFANVMMPSLSSTTQAWYVYEWSDAGGDHLPNNASEFVLVQSGN